jgi:hypothetical protein
VCLCVCGFITTIKASLSIVPEWLRTTPKHRFVEGARILLPLVSGSWYCFGLASRMTLSPHPSLGQELSRRDSESEVSVTSCRRKGEYKFTELSARSVQCLWKYFMQLCIWAEETVCVVGWCNYFGTAREATVFLWKIRFGVGSMGGQVSAQWPPISLPLMRKLTVGSFFLGLGLLASAVCRILASEFPERECCDPVYPLPAPPASTTPYPSAATPTGRSGEKGTWPFNLLF